MSQWTTGALKGSVNTTPPIMGMVLYSPITPLPLLWTGGLQVIGYKEEAAVYPSIFLLLQ